MSSRIVFSMDAVQFLHVMVDPCESVEELRLRLRDLLQKPPEAKNPVGRPLQANHPLLSQEELKHWRDVLFTNMQIRTMPEWAAKDGTRPERFASSQDDMLADEIRLDNGVIALLNSDLEGIDPAPRYQ